MRYSIRLLGLVCLICSAPAILAETPQENDDELPETVLDLPNGIKAIIVDFAGHRWRKVEPSALTGTEATDSDVCFEAKFERTVKPDRIRLFGKDGVIVVEEPAKFKAASEFKIGDNMRLFGTLRKAREGRGVEFVLVEMQKLSGDVVLFEKALKKLTDGQDADALKVLAKRIETLRDDPNGALDFIDADKLTSLRDKAYIAALNLSEKTIKADDADAAYALGLQWRDLVGRNSKYTEWVKRCLEIDPQHQKAIHDAEALGMELFDGHWMSHEDADKRRNMQTQQAELDRAHNREIQAKHEKALAQAVQARQSLLLQQQAELRGSSPQDVETKVASLGAEIQKSIDAGFGEEAVNLLANLDDRVKNVTLALQEACKSSHPEVRQQVFEALAWRGSRNPEALTALAELLGTEKDESASRAGVDAVVALGGKPAAATLIAALDVKTPAHGVQTQIMESLKAVTRQPFSNKDEWDKWWSDNKDSFK